MEENNFGWNTNPIYNLSPSIPEQRHDVQGVWKKAEIHTPDPRQIKVRSLSASSNDHLPPNPRRNVDDHIWITSSNFVTQQPGNTATSVHTSETSYTVQQHVSSPQRRTVTSTKMTVPTYNEMRPGIQAHYLNLQVDPRYSYNQGTKPMNRKDPTWNSHQQIPHDVTDHYNYSRQQTSRDEELEALKDELQEVKRNMRNMAEVILHIIANDIRDQQHQQNGSAVETQRYSTPSQYLPNNANTHVTKHHFEGVPNTAAELQPWDSNDNPGMMKPVGFEKHRTVFRDYPEKKDTHNLPGIMENQLYEGQVQEKKMTFGAGNSPIGSYPPTSGLQTYQSDYQGCETLKFESQHFNPVSVNFQEADTSLIQGQRQSSQQWHRSELEQLSGSLTNQPNDYAHRIPSLEEKHGDRKRMISLSDYRDEDARPSKNLRQNQMVFSSTPPGQSVLSSHPTLTRTMQSPYAKPKTAWKEPPQQQYVYGRGVVNQPPLTYQEMHKIYQTGLEGKSTRKEKARRCYSCRELGHLADSCCKASGSDTVDDISVTSSAPLDLSIDKH